MTIIKTEQIQIKPHHKLWNYCDWISFEAKNLQNKANYYVRQAFILSSKVSEDGKGIYMNYQDTYHFLKTSEEYKSLPAQTAQQTLKNVDRNWKSFFKAIKDWKKNKQKYKGRPKLPGYKHKIKGRSIVFFTNQQCQIKDGFIKFPKSEHKIKTRLKDVELREVRLVPKGSLYTVEIVYQQQVKVQELNRKRIAGIDLGVNNFITLVDNAGNEPVVIKGGMIKSMNQYYNKKRAQLMSYIGDKGISRRIQKLNIKRNNKIKDFMHKASKKIIDICSERQIGTLVVGYNEGWKQAINIGRRNNQTFVSIPFYQFLNMLAYKCTEAGIDLMTVNEAYTSGCSFLDDEESNKENYNKKRRIKRGLFRTNERKLINADVNSAYNIIRKAIPNVSFTDGIEGVVLHPFKLNLA